MGIRVAVNGFGRIGRSLARVLLKREDIDLVAVNDLAPVEQAAYLLSFDSVHGRFEGSVEYEEGRLIVDSVEIAYSNSTDPMELDFASLGADVVIECTGRFLTSKEVEHHIKKGVKRVIISAPAKDDTPTFVLGVNEGEYAGEKIISNASCTTNCLAPVAKILNERFGIQKGLITTVHSYTYDQNLLDNSHRRDLRRARAAALNMVPTTTGAARAIERVLPALKGKLDGRSVRVPVADVSLLDFDVLLSRRTTPQELRSLLGEYASGSMRGILGIDRNFGVSGDFIGSAYSCVVAEDLIQVVEGDMVKIMCWYDNEWGYANRLADMAKYITTV